MGEDAGGGLGRDDADVLVLVDDDAVEQGSVEHAAFSGFASVVEIAEVGKQVKELVETVPGAGIGGRHGVEASGDLVEAGADAFLLALEQVQRDRVGVVGLDELESFCFELVLLGFEELAFVVAGGFELVEHPVQHALYPFGFVLGEAVGVVGGFDALLDPLCEDRGADAGGALAAPSGTGEVLVPVAVLVAGPFDHELRAAGAVQGAFEVVVVLLGPFADGVLRVELGLDSDPGLGVDERGVSAVVGEAAEGDCALVVRVGQHLVKRGGRDRPGRLCRCRPRGETSRVEFLG
ncbi:MAG TPA: hypothetical protein VK046_06585 [Actinomycetaceae bacterium]|nr:hypothetical protein [Actinomycetaceae bacterium]